MTSIADGENQGPEVMDQLCENDKVVLLGQNQVSEEVLLIHHLEEITGGIGSSFKAIVCLQGFGTKAMSLQLTSCLMKECIEVNCPSSDSLWDAGSLQEFVDLRPPAGGRRREVKFRDFISLPPFIAKALIKSGTADPKEASFLISSACEIHYESIKDEPSAGNKKAALIHLLSFVWAMANNAVVYSACAALSNSEISIWNDRLHISNARPTSMPASDLGSIEGPSDAAWGQIALAIAGVKQALKEQVDDRKLERSEKKDKWGKALENHRDMILNFSTKNGSDPALSPSPDLLEVINIPSLAEAEAKVRSILKANGIRVKSPLILIKALCSGD